MKDKYKERANNPDRNTPESNFKDSDMNTPLEEIVELDNCIKAYENKKNTPFQVVKLENLTSEGMLFLKSNDGHCHCKNSLEQLLCSDTFRTHTPDLIGTFEKAVDMMKKGNTGSVI